MTFQKNLLLIIHPIEPINSATLQAYVSNGGRVLIADDFGMGDVALREFGINIRRERISSTQENFENRSCCPVIVGSDDSMASSDGPPILTGEIEVVTNYPASIYTEEDSGFDRRVPLLAFPEEAFVDKNYNGILETKEEGANDPIGLNLAEGFYVGKGKLAVISDPSIFINEMIEIGDNKRLYTDIIGWLTDGDTSTNIILVETHDKTDVQDQYVLDLKEQAIKEPYSMAFMVEPPFKESDPYWRLDAFDFYTGDKWIKSDTGLGNGRQRFISKGGRVFLQDGHISPFAPTPVGFYPVTPKVSSLRWPGRAGEGNFYITPYDSIYLNPGNKKGLSYTTELIQEKVYIEKIGGVTDIRGDIQTRYTQLPPCMPSSVKNLAQSLHRPETNVLEQVQLVSDFLKENFEYDSDIANWESIQDPPPSNQDITEWFLNRKRGVSAHFATLHVILLREMGIPARIVAGYTPGFVEEGVRKVMSGHAHYWSEVFIPGYGWTSFDPTGTTNQPVNFPPNNPAAISKIGMYLGSSKENLAQARNSYYQGSYEEAYKHAREGLEDLNAADELSYFDSRARAEKIVERLQRRSSFIEDDVYNQINRRRVGGEETSEFLELLNSLNRYLGESRSELEENNIEGASMVVQQGLIILKSMEEKMYGNKPKEKAKNEILKLEGELEDFRFGGLYQTVEEEAGVRVNVSRIVSFYSILPAVLVSLAALSFIIGRKYEMSILPLFRKEPTPTSEFRESVVESLESGDYSRPARILGEKLLKALEDRFQMERPKPVKKGVIQRLRKAFHPFLGPSLDPYKLRLVKKLTKEYPGVDGKTVYRLINRFERISRYRTRVKEKEMKRLYAETSELLKTIGVDLYEK
jgi:transglutaminase-like putative cysteine protease